MKDARASHTLNSPAEGFLREAATGVLRLVLSLFFRRKITAMIDELLSLFAAWRAGELPPPAPPKPRAQTPQAHSNRARPNRVRRPRAPRKAELATRARIAPKFAPSTPKGCYAKMHPNRIERPPRTPKITAYPATTTHAHFVTLS